jgi:glycosyltransferase involved in cell wall biosynthesis
MLPPVRIGLIVYGGVHRSGRKDVIPALVALIGALAERHQVHVFALAQEPEPSSYPLVGATVHNLAVLPAPRGQGLLRAVPAVVRAVRAVGGFDLLHAYMGVPAGAVAAIVAPILRLPLVVTFDGNELVALPDIDYGLAVRRRGRLLRRLIQRSAARITVCTGYMAGLARRQGIEPAVIPLGIDPPGTPPGPPAPPGPPWRLLHVASLNRVKDQPTLLRALSLVRERHPDVHLDIVGSDTLDGAIQAEAARQGHQAHVTFHGPVAADGVWPFYRRAHLHLLPSRHEAAGVAVLEAALCGVPTVGTTTGYVAEWSPTAARAVPPADPAALAAAITTLLAAPDTLRATGESARTRAQAITPAASAAAFASLYAEAATAYRGRTAGG